MLVASGKSGLASMRDHDRSRGIERQNSLEVRESSGGHFTRRSDAVQECDQYIRSKMDKRLSGLTSGIFDLEMSGYL